AVVVVAVFVAACTVEAVALNVAGLGVVVVADAPFVGALMPPLVSRRLRLHSPVSSKFVLARGDHLWVVDDWGESGALGGRQGCVKFFHVLRANGGDRLAVELFSRLKRNVVLRDGGVQGALAFSLVRCRLQRISEIVTLPSSCTTNLASPTKSAANSDPTPRCSSSWLSPSRSRQTRSWASRPQRHHPPPTVASCGG